MVENVVLKFNAKFILLNLITGIFSFGIVPVILFLVTRSYPKIVDKEGLTTRGGKRFYWKDLKKIQQTEAYISLAGKVVGPFEMFFEGKIVRLQPTFTKNASEVAKFVKELDLDVPVTTVKWGVKPKF